jgi:hypothetical protein
MLLRQAYYVQVFLYNAAHHNLDIRSYSRFHYLKLYIFNYKDKNKITFLLRTTLLYLNIYTLLYYTFKLKCAFKYYFRFSHNS